MRSLSLVITLGTSQLRFFRGDVHSSAIASYELLLDVSSLRVVANTPQVTGAVSRQAPTIKVTLDNPKHKLFKLLGLPFRRTAQLFDADGVVLFTGKIRTVDYGRTVSMELSV